jgi:hypothetical protein
LSIITPFVAAVAALIAAFVVSFLTDRREREKRRVDFITRQLSEFYGPLVSIRAEILARSELRVKVGNAAQEEWPKLYEGVRNVEIMQRISEGRAEAYRRIIDYDNKALRDRLMPAYQNMILNFREKMWLAEPATRSYFPALIEFVEVWERHLGNAMPIEVIQRLDHSESNLDAFYRHLEETHDSLRLQLKG